MKSLNLSAHFWKRRALYFVPRFRSAARRKMLIAIILLLLVMPASCSPVKSNLIVFAAAGAKLPLDEIAGQFQKKYGITIEINYGGGGAVLNQMVLSRSGDIYVAPEQGFMETAKQQQAIDPETIKSLAYMIPVIAVPKGNPKHITRLADLVVPGIRIAVGRTETTLLGKIAPQIFEKAGLSDAISKNIVATAPDCQSMLTMLVMGSVDAVITWNFYGTSAGDKIDIIRLNPEQVTGVGQVMAAVSSYSKNAKTASKLIDFMASAEAKDVFKKNGYITDAWEVSQYWH